MTRIEIGIAVSEMTVARQFIRNSDQHDRDDDGSLDQHRLDVVDRRLDERRLPELNVGRLDAFGQRFLKRGEFGLDRLCVSGSVSAVGIFCTLMMMAGAPLKPASPRFVLGANETSASSCRSIVRPRCVATATFFSCSRSSVSPTLRIRYSLPCWSTKPPPELVPKLRIAASMLLRRKLQGPSWRRCSATPGIAGPRRRSG